MSEVTADELIERKTRDRARLKRVATKHGAVFLAAITLWGTADAWASSTGMTLAALVAVFNALFAGAAMSYLVHEWGHFTAARLAGAASPVLKEPQSFFMFSFKHESNSRAQFIAMSLGGPLSNWALVAAVALTLPLSTVSQAALLGTCIYIAVNVCVFELPVIYRVLRGQEPEATVQKRLGEVGVTGPIAGLTAGGLVVGLLLST